MNADTPSETECRPHIEKALNTLKGDNKGKIECSLFFIAFKLNNWVLIWSLSGTLDSDSAEVVVEVDDSKEENDVASADDDDDDDSDEVKSDLNADDDDSKEGI